MYTPESLGATVSQRPQIERFVNLLFVALGHLDSD